MAASIGILVVVGFTATGIEQEKVLEFSKPMAMAKIMIIDDHNDNNKRLVKTILRKDSKVRESNENPLTLR